LDALPTDVFKRDSDPSADSSCNTEASSSEQKAISGLDVALSEDYTHRQNSNRECLDSASRNNCMESGLAVAEAQDTLITSDVDTLPDGGGFDDIVALEAEGDSQFEQTMAMLRDLSGSEVCPAIVSCLADSPLQAESAAKTETELNGGDCSQTSASDCDRNNANSDDVSSLGASALAQSECKVAVIQTDRQNVSSSLADRKPKASSGFFNRCIENLLQRGRETAAAARTGPAADPPFQNRSAPDCEVPVAAVSSGRSHRKSRKPTKLCQMRLSHDVVIVSARSALPLRCHNCSYTCNSSADLASHSANCGVDPPQQVYRQFVLLTSGGDFFSMVGVGGGESPAGSRGRAPGQGVRGS